MGSFKQLDFPPILKTRSDGSFDYYFEFYTHLEGGDIVQPGIYSIVFSDGEFVQKTAGFQIGDPIFGCTDPAALNYDSGAQASNNSCQYPISGCTDPQASNYNPSANQEDDSCEYNAIADSKFLFYDENYAETYNLNEPIRFYYEFGEELDFQPEIVTFYPDFENQPEIYQDFTHSNDYLERNGSFQYTYSTTGEKKPKVCVKQNFLFAADKIDCGFLYGVSRVESAATLEIVDPNFTDEYCSNPNAINYQMSEKCDYETRIDGLTDRYFGVRWQKEDEKTESYWEIDFTQEFHEESLLNKINLLVDLDEPFENEDLPSFSVDLLNDYHVRLFYNGNLAFASDDKTYVPPVGRRFDPESSNSFGAEYVDFSGEKLRIFVPENFLVLSPSKFCVAAEVFTGFVIQHKNNGEDNFVMPIEFRLLLDENVPTDPDYVKPMGSDYCSTDEEAFYEISDNYSFLGGRGFLALKILLHLCPPIHLL